jgi:hypothetical protein
MLEAAYFVRAITVPSDAGWKARLRFAAVRDRYFSKNFPEVSCARLSRNWAADRRAGLLEGTSRSVMGDLAVWSKVPMICGAENDTAEGASGRVKAVEGFSAFWQSETEDASNRNETTRLGVVPNIQSPGQATL